MLIKIKSFFRRFFTNIKDNKYVKKISKGILPVIAVATSAVAIFFGIKYMKLKSILSEVECVLSQTKSALYATSSQATQLMLDNEILSELLGMVLHVPGEIYA